MIANFQTVYQCISVLQSVRSLWKISILSSDKWCSGADRRQRDKKKKMMHFQIRPDPIRDNTEPYCAHQLGVPLQRFIESSNWITWRRAHFSPVPNLFHNVPIFHLHPGSCCTACHCHGRAFRVIFSLSHNIFITRAITALLWVSPETLWM